MAGKVTFPMLKIQSNVKMMKDFLLLVSKTGMLDKPSKHHLKVKCKMSLLNYTLVSKECVLSNKVGIGREHCGYYKVNYVKCQCWTGLPGMDTKVIIYS